MTGNQMKISKLLGILLIINILIFLCSCKQEYKKKSIDGHLYIDRNSDYKFILFNYEGMEYYITIDNNYQDDYYKFFVTMKNPKCDMDQYNFSSIFYKNEIYLEGVKNEQGLSLRYDTDLKDSKVYYYPLTNDQLETIVDDNAVLILPPEF